MTVVEYHSMRTCTIQSTEKEGDLIVYGEAIPNLALLPLLPAIFSDTVPQNCKRPFSREPTLQATRISWDSRASLLSLGLCPQHILCPHLDIHPI